MKIKEENIVFAKRKSVKQIEEGSLFCPKFNLEGLLPCITIEAETNQVLMFSFLNEVALKKTILTKKAHYYSRSRSKVWLKGEISGMSHDIDDIFVDDDQDSIIYIVKLNKPFKGGKEASCHVGYKSCFYRKVLFKDKQLSLIYTEDSKVFNPEIVYKGIKNPTKI